MQAVLNVHGVNTKSFSIKMLRCIFYIKKKFMEKHLCLFAHKLPYVPYETNVERMVGSISSSSNVHEVVDDNSNCYRSIVMDAMRKN